MKLRSFLFSVAGVVGVMVIMTDDRIGRWVVTPKPVVVEVVDTCPAGVGSIQGKLRDADASIIAGEVIDAMQTLAHALALPCDGLDPAVREHQASAWFSLARAFEYRDSSDVVQRMKPAQESLTLARRLLSPPEEDRYW